MNLDHRPTSKVSVATTKRYSLYQQLDNKSPAEFKLDPSWVPNTCCSFNNASRERLPPKVAFAAVPLLSLMDKTTTNKQTTLSGKPFKQNRTTDNKRSNLGGGVYKPNPGTLALMLHVLTLVIILCKLHVDFISDFDISDPRMMRATDHNLCDYNLSPTAAANFAYNDKDGVAPSSIWIPSHVDPAVHERLAHVTHMIHTNTRPIHNDPLKNCSLTSQVRIDRYDTHWMLQTLDRRGNYKTCGGDEFYVTYTEGAVVNNNNNLENAIIHAAPPTAVARITDKKNGKYRLDFVTVPLANLLSSLTENTGDFVYSSTTVVGTVTVHFQYSCSIGQMPQPTKKGWTTGGSTELSFSVANVSRPAWCVFRQPTGIDLSQFDFVLTHGDSLMGHFTGHSPHHKTNIWWHGNIKRELNNHTLPAVLDLLERGHGRRLRQCQKEGSAVALVLGSAMWDLLQTDNLQGTNFSDHLQACRDLVHAVRHKYPMATVFWKSPSAGHRHRAGCTEHSCESRLQYLSTSRVEYLHKQQNLLMQELKVPVLDIYEGSYLSAHWTRDAMHFQDRFDKEIIGWFYNDTHREVEQDPSGMSYKK